MVVKTTKDKNNWRRGINYPYIIFSIIDVRRNSQEVLKFTVYINMGIIIIRLIILVD